MAYEIHIERDNGQKITIDEWSDAIAAVEGVRLTDGCTKLTNPKTGQVIEIPSIDGDAEVFFPEFEQWLCCIRFSNGRGSFPVRHESATLRRVASALATKLSARLVGDTARRTIGLIRPRLRAGTATRLTIRFCGTRDPC